MEAGAHTSRVQRNLARIGESFGYDVAVTLFQRTVMISVSRRDDFSVNHTLLRKISHGSPVNFSRISRLSTLSWEACDEKLTLEGIRSRYEDIMGQKRISRWLVLFFVAIANAAFCRLFEGDCVSMGFVFMATLAAFFLRQEMARRHVNHLVMVTTCAIAASFIAGLDGYFNLGTTPSISVATSVLFLVPGVLLINAVMDVLQGYVLIGLSRAISAFNLIICIAVGLSVTLFLLGMTVI